jgi:hypothetical protein
VASSLSANAAGVNALKKVKYKKLKQANIYLAYIYKFSKYIKVAKFFNIRQVSLHWQDIDRFFRR